MSENPSVKSNTAVTEAPASWNTRYTSPEGFICQITIRADSGKELLVKAQAAIAHLLEVGCTPCDNLTFRSRSNGNHAETNAEGTSSTKVCPVHNVEMRRWEKNGKVWFSHKQEGGSWCTGKGK